MRHSSMARCVSLIRVVASFCGIAAAALDSGLRVYPELSRNDQEEISRSAVHADSRPTVSSPTEINADEAGISGVWGEGDADEIKAARSAKSSGGCFNYLHRRICGRRVYAYALRAHMCLRIYMNP